MIFGLARCAPPTNSPPATMMAITVETTALRPVFARTSSAIEFGARARRFDPRQKRKHNQE